MNVDLLMQHSIFCDYPIWRMNLNRHRNKFNKVILYPSDHNREVSFKDFLYQQIPETWVKDHVIDWTTPGIDWRQAETEPMLPLVESEWIYFTEPDWFVKDYDKFYSAVEGAMKTADAIGWWSETTFPYIHPSCFFIKREILDKTNKDFRAHPETIGSDHFATVSRDLEKLGAKIITTEDMGFKYWEDCFHLGGLTSNYIDAAVNPDYVFHRSDIFYVYNYWVRQATVPKNMTFLDLSSKVEEMVKKQLIREIDPKTSEWAAFFK